MTPEAIALRQKLVEMCKGIISTQSSPEFQIRLLKGVVATGQDLLVELRAHELVASVRKL